MRSTAAATAAAAAANNSPENATGPSRIFHSKPEGIAFCTAFILVSVFVVVGNLLAIVLFAVNRSLRKRSLFLVINMAFADLMIGTVALPIYIYGVGANFQLWAGGRMMVWYTLYIFFDAFFTLASSLTAAFIAGERLYATYRPLKHRTLSTRTYRIIIVMVWTLALLVAAIWITFYLFISTKDFMYLLMLYALLLIFIICGTHIAIWRKFRSGRAAPQQENRASQKKRLTKTLMLVSMLTLLSWLPISSMHYVIYVGQVQIASKFYLPVVVLTYSNSFVNPLLYALRIPGFRKALILCCLRRPVAPSHLSKEEIGKTLVWMPATQRRTFPRENSHLQLAFEQEVKDTKL